MVHRTKRDAEALATKLGYTKGFRRKRDVALKIRDYVVGEVSCLPCAVQRIVSILPWQQKVWIFVKPCLMETLASLIIKIKLITARPLLSPISPGTKPDGLWIFLHRHDHWRRINKETDYFTLMDYSNGILFHDVGAKPYLIGKRFYGADYFVC